MEEWSRTIGAMLAEESGRQRETKFPMAEIEHFADRGAPVLLWRDEGRYANLFRWLAVRCLSNPDNVPQCESIHAQWQWVAAVARGIKLKQLSAVLQLRAWIQQCGVMPNDEQLGPYLTAVTADARRRYTEILAARETGPRQSTEGLYIHRCNLLPMEVEVLGGRRVAHDAGRTPAASLMRYFRSPLRLGSFY